MSEEMHKRLLALEVRADMIHGIKREVGRLTEALATAQGSLIAQSEEIEALRGRMDRVEPTRGEIAVMARGDRTF